MAFFTVGLAICLLSAYVNSFLVMLSANLLEADASAIRLTPVCEEVLKAFPLFVYIALFKPEKDEIIRTALAVGMGFATLENCCYLIQYGASEFLFVLVRGFSAGIMHAVCAAALGYGVAFVMSRKHLAFPGAVGMLCVTTTFHAIYNLFVSASGAWQAAGYFLPVTAAAILIFFLKSRHGRALEG
jgi:RsiW-degrading membrane proteinase PrsW (M82 family)